MSIREPHDAALRPKVVPQRAAMHAYYLRIALVAMALIAATVAVAIWVPRPEPISITAQSPNRDNVPTDTTISITFSREPDRASAQRSFAIHPPIKGSFAWQDTTLVFRPSEPLQPDTTYRVFLRGGLRDAQGRLNISSYYQWPFQTSNR